MFEETIIANLTNLMKTINSQKLNKPRGEEIRTHNAQYIKE